MVPLGEYQEAADGLCSIPRVEAALDWPREIDIGGDAGCGR